MQWVEIEEIFASGLLVVAGSGKNIKQLRIHRIELLAHLRMSLLVDDFKLTRHNLECRYRFHVVLHAVVSPIGLLQLFGVDAVECRRMRDKEQVGITVLIHELLSHLLQLFQHGYTNGVGHNVGKLVPNNQQTVIRSQLCQTVLHLTKPLLDVVVVKAYIELCLTQRVAHAVEYTKVACLQAFCQLITVGNNRRQSCMSIYQMIPYFRILAYLLNVVFIICRHSYLYLVLVEGFSHRLLQDKSEIAWMGHCSQSINIDREQTLRLAK